MKPLAIGVIGVGRLGSLHAKMLSNIPSVRLVGIVDADRERAQRIASELHVTAFDSVVGLLNQVDAVSIATPTTTHSEIARQAIDRKVHVFIEKPIASTVAEAEDLVRFAREKGTQVQIGHIERFNPALLAVEHYKLDPMFIESHRLAQFNPRGTDVAVVLDLMIHDIDIILSLVHSPVRSIEANGVPIVSETIDIANARLQFENGCVANVTSSRISQKKMRKMRLFQRNAYISIDFLDGAAEVFRLVESASNIGDAAMMLGDVSAGTIKRSVVYERPTVKELNALQCELASFVRAVVEHTTPMVSGEDGVRALCVAEEIVDKINRQQPLYRS
jgi:predicted dehydrogenase